MFLAKKLKAKQQINSKMILIARTHFSNARMNYSREFDSLFMRTRDAD